MQNLADGELLQEEVEEDCRAEEEICPLQCGDSLAIAINHIGEDAPRIKKLLRRTLRLLGRSR